MIVRTWRGFTRKRDGDSYVEYMGETGLTGYLNAEGNHGALLLRRDREDTTEFLFLSLWDSIASVRSFAGDDYERAIFYPRDDDFLVDRDLHVDHYEVALDGFRRETSPRRD